MKIFGSLILFILLNDFFYCAPSSFGENIQAPEIISPTWINSEPLKMEELRGMVVMVEFWTFGCWNCRNIEPYVKEWHKKYGEKGLVVIAVHSPEFSHEKK
jgi:thiol-disulfide isomerase/thioredoxin